MIISIISVFLLFSLVILTHEFGHFWVAKKVGIKVEKFSLGFGPKIFSWKRGETIYQISLIPFGGFVKMAGEEYEEKKEFEKWEYIGKPPGERAKVLISGSIHNFIFGFFLLIPAFMIGISGFDGTKIGSFVEGLPAETSGLKIGDEIIEVNNKRCREWFDVMFEIKNSTSKNKEKPIEIKVKRNEELLTFSIKPGIYIFTDQKGTKEILYLIGISPTLKMEKYKFFPATVRAGKEVYRVVYRTFDGIIKLIKKEISFQKSFAGPIGIAKWGAEISHQGIGEFLHFLCIISISIGFFNFIPFFGLDGGHLFGVLLEKILKKKPKKKLLEITQLIGIVCLVCLALYVTYNDFLRILEERIKK